MLKKYEGKEIFKLLSAKDRRIQFQSLAVENIGADVLFHICDYTIDPIASNCHKAVTLATDSYKLNNLHYLGNTEVQYEIENDDKKYILR